MSKYNGFEMLEWMELLQVILQRSRPWHAREQRQTDWNMHPAVIAAVAVCRPADWKGMVLEWPHIADDDKRQIAYTRDERAGEADRQVMTSIGKYLKRHFPSMSDHVLRDITALHQPSGVEFKFLHTNAEMRDAVDKGPWSCMCARYHSGKEDFWTDPQSHTEGNHPYDIYDPELGWHLAIATEGNEVTGRAVCKDKLFVRSYKATGDTGSTTDERLDAWLFSKGYTKQVSWEYGTLFKHLPLRRYNFVAPYIDGGQYNVIVNTHNDTLELVDYTDLKEGDLYYSCRNTRGVPSQHEIEPPEDENSVTCEDCDETFDGDDACYVGAYTDRCVCSDCRENNYTYAYTRGGNEEYIDNDHVIEVRGYYYHYDYLSSNGVVELHDGGYALQDDAIYIERVDGWFESDDCTYCESSGEHERSDDCHRLHDGEYAHEDDCWECEHSDEYYLNSVDYMMTECGKRIHPAYAEHYITETEGE
jgi:hypothetical protein